MRKQKLYEKEERKKKESLRLRKNELFTHGSVAHIWRLTTENIQNATFFKKKFRTLYAKLIESNRNL